MPIPPPDQTPAILLSEATGIMLRDLTWHPLAQSLGMVMAPAFVDPLQVGPDGEPIVIVPGAPWIQFVDSVTGQAFAAPLDSIVAVELAGEFMQAIAPQLVDSAVKAAPALRDRFRPLP